MDRVSKCIDHFKEALVLVLKQLTQGTKNYIKILDGGKKLGERVDRASKCLYILSVCNALSWLIIAAM